MKALRSILALVFVLSLTLTSVAPAAANSAVTSFTGTMAWDPTNVWNANMVQRGPVLHITDWDFNYLLVTDDDRVGGVLNIPDGRTLINVINGKSGPDHGTFTISTSEGVVWEGVARGEPIRPGEPSYIKFTAQGRGSNAGLTLKFNFTFYDINVEPGTVSGQVIGK